MPIFFQHQINETTRLGIWKIEEPEDFFLSNVPVHREVTHPHKRLQHLAGRFLLQFLFPGFPYDLIRIADTRKPYLPSEQYHFSISHCGDYAAAVVSTDQRVGIDIEILSVKAEKVKDKFLTSEEQKLFSVHQESRWSHHSSPPLSQHSRVATLLWCAKECIFKWYGTGEVDFRRHIQLKKENESNDSITCFFAKTNEELVIQYHYFDQLVVAWVGC